MAIVVGMGTRVDRAPSETDEDRGFNEMDLRRMLEQASGYGADIMVGRFVIEARHVGQSWAVIVEPDEGRQLLVVITAYPLDQAPS